MGIITTFSLRNPLVVAALSVVLCVFGLFAYFSLGVAITPNVNYPSVVVTTVYPGADPETVEANVTRPIEEAVATLANIDTNGLTSTSMSGVSIVNVQFTGAANADLVSNDVQRVVNGIRGKLPADAEVPSVTKVDINALGVAKVVLSGPQPLTQLQDIAENLIQPELNALPGVGATQIRSGVTREVHLTVDQEKLRTRGLSITNVIGALQSQQIEVPAGTIADGTKDFSVFFDSLASNVDALGDLVVAPTPGGSMLLKDVATIDDTFKERTGLVRVDDQEGIALVVVKLPDANVISTVEGVKHKVEELKPRLPANTSLDVVIDGSRYTTKSFSTVRNALLEAVAVTGLILLLFLHTWRGTLTVLVSIPVSLLSTLALMAALHYNLNLLTMVALTVSVGILVDDSIVVLENISKHLVRGKPPLQAAIDGRNEIGMAALTITLVDVVVYVPIAAMTTGLPAQFLGPFAVVITAATLSSLVVSFTLTPLMAKLMLRDGEEQSGNTWLVRFGRVWDRGFDKLERGYGSLLGVALPNRWAVIAIGLASFAAGIALLMFGFIGFDFFPSGDQSEIDLTLTLPPATSLQATNALALQVERDIKATYPEIYGTSTALGTSSAGGVNVILGASNQAQIIGLLVPPTERRRGAVEIAEDMRHKLEGRYTNARVRLGVPNAFGFGGFGNPPVQVQVQGSAPATVDATAKKIEQAIRGVPGAVGIDNSNDDVQTQVRARVDWTHAADLGVSARDAGAALRAALDGFTSNTSQYRQPGQKAVPIRVLTAGADSLTQRDLAQLPISGGKGVVKLGQFTNFETTEVPTSIQHVNRLRSVTIGVNAGDGVLVGDLQNAVQKAVKTVPLPAGYSVTYAGSGQIGGSAFGDLARAMGVAVLLMYMLMMMLFGSLMRPLVVLFSLPLALIGALGAMALAHSAFTLFSMLGVAVLLGLVGKNAILLIDRTDNLRRAGVDRFTALLQAGPSRLRPIVMTTVSVMAALLPIVSGVEEGSELLQSVALVLIGGLLTSTLLTLVFIPAMYTVLDDIQVLCERLIGFVRRSAVRSVDTAPQGLGVEHGDAPLHQADHALRLVDA
ncbi:MAG TPA: efflux RND transporter permease subunit [Chloroflexota bacterium]|nr:efflux RND transporter permease subunit [Chloroflexota bacterium]